MSKAYKIHEGARIDWPEICVFCGKEETKTIQIERKKYTGLGLWTLGLTVKYRYVTRIVHICAFHRLAYMILRFVRILSFTVLVFAAITFIGGVGGDPFWTDSERILMWVCTPVALGLYLSSAYYLPVRVTSSGKTIVNSRSCVFMDQFKRLNHHVI